MGTHRAEISTIYSPAEDGSLLVVTGDVSGKGMKAAMLVAGVAWVRSHVLELVYRSEYRVHNDLFLILMAAGGAKSGS